ncbi:MAG: nucleotidyltransferase family protein [Nitrospira sp.]|nr:nucleotidyltransferase family protein [bacterium]MBL7050172.1 nucleotidyltransferase family protein [Nitrospira sp.]
MNKTIMDRREDILSIARNFGAKSVRVFGSVARGDDNPESDLDIILEMEPGASLLDIIAIKQDIEELLDLHVDVVTESSISPYIRDKVIKEAVSL